MLNQNADKLKIAIAIMATFSAIVTFDSGKLNVVPKHAH